MPVSAVTRGGCVSVSSGIENRHAERGPLVAAGHFDVRLGVGDQRVRLRFAAGAGGGRHGDHRQQRAGRLALAPIVLHPPAARIEEVDPLRAIHRAAAAEADDQVRPKLLGDGEAGVDVRGRRILLRRRRTARRSGPPAPATRCRAACARPRRCPGSLTTSTRFDAQARRGRHRARTACPGRRRSASAVGSRTECITAGRSSARSRGGN